MAPPQKSALPLLIGIGVVVLGLAVALIVKATRHEPKKAPVVVAPPEPTPAPAPAPVVAPPPPAPKPVAPVVTAATITRKLESARTVPDVTELAHDAEKLGDAALAQKCWERLYQLDAQNEEARKKLDVRPLNPADDLPGYTAIEHTAQKFHLKPFAAQTKEAKTKAERAEIVADWEKARAEIEARTKPDANPYFKQVDDLRVDLEHHRFFGTLDYDTVERPPYVLFVELSGTPEEHEKRIKQARKSYTTFLDAYDAKIRSYLFPISPKPPKVDPLLPVFVFRSVERYHQYEREVEGHETPPTVRAYYLPHRKQCFTWSTTFELGYGEFSEGVTVLLHELTHAWVDQLASDDGGETRSIEKLGTHWFSEGIAEYMSNLFWDRGDVRFQPWRSGRVVGTYRPPGWRIPIKEALGIPMHGLDAWASLRVKDVPDAQKEDATGRISVGFYSDMSNFILWLHFKSGANRAAQFAAYAKEELAGKGGMETFKRCFPGLLEEVPDLDKAVDDFVLKIANGKINPYVEIAETEGPGPAKQ